RHGGDGGDAEALVDDGPPRVVDPGDDTLDAERLVRDAGAQDVRVVAARHRREGAGIVDAGLGEDVLVEPETGDGLATEGPEAPELVGALVDDGDRVAGLLEADGELAPDPPAAHYDDVHGHEVTDTRSGRRDSGSREQLVAGVQDGGAPVVLADGALDHE